MSQVRVLPAEPIREDEGAGRHRPAPSSFAPCFIGPPWSIMSVRESSDGGVRPTRRGTRRRSDRRGSARRPRSRRRPASGSRGRRGAGKSCDGSGATTASPIAAPSASRASTVRSPNGRSLSFDEAVPAAANAPVLLPTGYSKASATGAAATLLRRCCDGRDAAGCGPHATDDEVPGPAMLLALVKRLAFA